MEEDVLRTVQGIHESYFPMKPKIAGSIRCVDAVGDNLPKKNNLQLLLNPPSSAPNSDVEMQEITPIDVPTDHGPNPP
jgi:hypothetical protein